MCESSTERKYLWKVYLAGFGEGTEHAKIRSVVLRDGRSKTLLNSFYLPFSFSATFHSVKQGPTYLKVVFKPRG